MEIEKRKTTLYLNDEECKLIRICLILALIHTQYFNEKELQKLKWLKDNIVHE